MPDVGGDRHRGQRSHSSPAQAAMRCMTLALLAACGAHTQPLDSHDDCAVIEATIGELQAAMRAHRTTCRAIVQTYIDRIHALDQPKLNAITRIAPDALAQADAIHR